MEERDMAIRELEKSLKDTGKFLIEFDLIADLPPLKPQIRHGEYIDGVANLTGEIEIYTSTTLPNKDGYFEMNTYKAKDIPVQCIVELTNFLKENVREISEW